MSFYNTNHKPMNEQLLKKTKRRMANYCAYRDRAEIEVREKLANLELSQQEIDYMVNLLQEEDFLNEERFAKSFAGSKFRLKKWGKLKIKRELKNKGLSNDLIELGLNEIEGQAYLETLEELAQNKFEQYKNEDLLNQKTKVARFLTVKGYESALVWGVINRLG